MISRGCLILAVLLSPALSHPVPSERPDKENSQLMKCIMEVLADTLTKPQHAEISQECLDVLSGDERITSILNHQNLLRELHEVAVQGSSDRAHHLLQSGRKVEHGHLTKKPRSHPGSNTSAVALSTAEESMLETSEKQTVGMTGNTLGGTSRLDQEKQGGEVDSEKHGKEDFREGKPLVVNANIDFGKEAAEENHLNDSEEKDYGAHVYKGSKAGPGMQDTEKSAEEEEEEPGEKQGGEMMGEKLEEEELSARDRKNKDVHSQETEVQRTAVAQERHLVTQGESEEGSANSRPEDNEIERLAAIESELGNLAWRLRQLRRS